MKNIIMLLAVLTILIGCAKKPETMKQQESSKETEEYLRKSKATKHIFKGIGYYKSETSMKTWQSFTIYTNSKDKNEMIEFTRKQPYISGGQTFVHFFKNESKTPDISKATDDDSGLYLLDENNYQDNLIATYQRNENGNEYWWPGDGITNDHGTSKK